MRPTLFEFAGGEPVPMGLAMPRWSWTACSPTTCH